MPETSNAEQKIYSGLLVAGIGDALGAPTEQYSMAEIQDIFGEGLIDKFYAPRMDTFAGANHGKIAEITDDASQMYYLASALAAKGRDFSNEDWVNCLLSWHETSPKAGFMGPSTEAMIKALKAGEDPTRFGLIGQSERKMTNIGITNGAAMCSAPIGMCFPGDLETAAKYTLQTCLPSHDASVAIEAACAVSCGTSMAMQAKNVNEIIEGCKTGARRGRELTQEFGRLEAGPRFLVRLERALEIAEQSKDDFVFLNGLENEIGSSVLAAESVPCAIAILAYSNGDPWYSIKLAATIGNDSDSIAAMVGAIAATFNGYASIPENLRDDFLKANDDFDLPNLAHALASKFEIS